MDALIYAANPTAMIENWSRDQPNSIRKYPNPELPELMVLVIIAVISTNGTGINTKSLYTAKITKVKIIFFLIVGFSRTS